MVEPGTKTIITSIKSGLPPPDRGELLDNLYHDALFRGMVNVLSILYWNARSGVTDKFSFDGTAITASVRKKTEFNITAGYTTTKTNGQNGPFTYNIFLKLPTKAPYSLTGTAEAEKGQIVYDSVYTINQAKVVLNGPEGKMRDPQEIKAKLKKLGIDLETPEGQKALASAINDQAAT